MKINTRIAVKQRFAFLFFLPYSPFCNRQKSKPGESFFVCGSFLSFFVFVSHWPLLWPHGWGFSDLRERVCCWWSFLFILRLNFLSVFISVESSADVKRIWILPLDRLWSCTGCDEIRSSRRRETSLTIHSTLQTNVCWPNRPWIWRFQNRTAVCATNLAPVAIIPPVDCRYYGRSFKAQLCTKKAHTASWFASH